ncbi:hypothetical protein GCM10023264_08560 [Sphingomonas daechungensis]|uniref:hypothetical protein n=1 Tax=Sphingomonas daechungensis TaxID=1176646 RepID=UPI0031EC06C7
MSRAAELIELGGALERSGQYAAAWKNLDEGGELKRPPDWPKWEGPGSSCSTLLVRRRIRHLGAELRNARFANMAVPHVERVIAVTEPRLKSLLARSFPQVTYVEATQSVQADCESSYEGLSRHFGSTEEAIAASFQPLVAETSGEPSGVGIAWHSINQRKHLPELDDWAARLAGMTDALQSLQYDEAEAEIDRLETLSGKRIARSPLDQKLDVDGFASMVAAVKGVLTISNTTAHMAGALGKSCVVILDDLDHLSWPVSGDRTPFYPTLRLVRRNQRPWNAVLDEAVVVLRTLIEHAE